MIIVNDDNINNKKWLIMINTIMVIIIIIIVIIIIIIIIIIMIIVVNILIIGILSIQTRTDTHLLNMIRINLPGAVQHVIEDLFSREVILRVRWGKLLGIFSANSEHDIV